MDAGDHIILLIDGNSNMKNSDLSNDLSLLTMKEAILEKHGRHGPSTHKRNANSTPIDGIWVTQGLEILSSGYFGYDDVFPSDHRCLWLDPTFQAAFGHNMAPLSKRTPRRLHCKDPRLIQNYIKLFHQYASPLNLFDRVKEREKRASSLPKSEVIQEYEDIDILRCQAVAFAERYCRKLRIGQVAFSPELNASQMKIQAWLLLMSRAKNNKVSSRLLKRRLKKAQLDSTTRGMPLQSLEESLRNEYKAYYQWKGDANLLRTNALEELAMALAEQGNVTKEKMLKALRDREQQRSTARKIRYIQGKIRTGSTTMVSVTDSEGNRQDITERIDIERAIRKINHQKFTQSANTPFYLPPLSTEFRFKGMTSATHATLAGLYDSYHDIVSRILEVIAQWKMPQAVTDVGPHKMEMTLDSYISFWKKAKRDTSCYPSTLSFSTMKAGAFDSDIAALDCSMM